MANVKELQETILNAKAELSKEMNKELTAIVTKRGNVMEFSTPLNVSYDNHRVTLHSLLTICNLDPDLVVVRKINQCANFNVIRFADLSDTQQSAIYHAVTRSLETANAKPDKAYYFPNLEYGHISGLYKSTTTGDILMLPQGYEVDPRTGEIGTLRLLQEADTDVLLMSMKYVQGDVAFIQTRDKTDGSIDAVAVVRISFNDTEYLGRYATNDDNFEVVVAPQSLQDAMLDKCGEIDYEIDNGVAYYTDDAMLRTLNDKDLQAELHKESPDYFPAEY